MTTKPVILVVDDEPQILRVFRATLPPRGFEVRTAASGQQALEEVSKEAPDLIILDLVMPGLTGVDVCRTVRENSEVPIIVLSAKGSERDKVLALEFGADDYITKPFGMDELIARIRAVLRRVPKSGMEQLSAAGVVMDIDRRKVTVDDREVKLTPKEFEVLRVLMSNAGSVVTHRSILKSVWGLHATEQTEYIRGIINQLRRKIEPDPEKPTYILTEPWIGYRFRD